MLKKKISAHTLRAISFLWLGSLLAAGCAFLTQVVLARNLSPKHYGAVSAVLTAFSLIAPIAGFGVQGLWLRVFGKEGFKAIRWMQGSLKFCILSTAAAALILCVWAFVGSHDKQIAFAFLIVAVCVVSQPVIELLGVRFQLEEKYVTLAAWQLAPHVLRLVMVLILVYAVRRPITTIEAIAPYFFSSLFVVFLGYKGLRSMYQGQIELKGHSALSSEVLLKTIDLVSPLDVFRNAWPFGFSVFFHLIYFQSAVLFLKYVAGDHVAGVYNVAFIVMSAVYIFPAVIYHKFLIPKQHRWAEHDRRKFFDVYKRGNVYMSGIGLLFAGVVVLSANWLISFVFGDAYVEAADYLFILSLCIPLRFVATSVGATLLTQEHMLRKVKYMGGVAMCNVLSNLVLLPKYGGLGACYSALLSEIVLLIVYFYAARKYVFADFK